MSQWIKIEKLSNYLDSICLMESILSGVIEGKEDTIILLEYHDVITSGTNSRQEEVLDNSIEVIQTGRGGKHTYHGPGQRVIYPIINLNETIWGRDLKKYLNFLHIWIINTLKTFNIESYKRDDHIGVWTKKDDIDHKIAAIGIRARKWVAYHGIAVNINTDLKKYSSFIPCGISDLGVTSIKDLGHRVTSEEFDEELKKQYYLNLKMDEII